jgi:hypothetical protein
MQKLIALSDEDSFNKYIEQYKTWITGLNLLSSWKESALKELFLNRTEAQKATISHQIITATNSIADYTQHIHREWEHIRRHQITLNAYENETTNHIDELIQFLATDKNIKNYNIGDGFLQLDIVSPLVYFDIEIAKALANNPLFIGNNDEFISWLFKKLFVTTELTLHTNTRVEITLDNDTVKTKRLRDSHYTAQPHLNLRTCWGTAKAYIEEALIFHNYVHAISQIIAATKNINLADGVVTNDFIEQLKLKSDEVKQFEKLYLKEVEENALHQNQGLAEDTDRDPF